MRISEIINKEIWENFLLQCEEKTFLNSWNWGEFNKANEKKIWRLGVYQNNELIAIALIIKIRAKRGTFLFIPHGPNIPNKRNNKIEILEILLTELKKIAKEEGVSFIRISPIWERTEENIKIFKKLNFREAPFHIHPEITWELNIEPSEEKLLMGMRKTTRYLIRQANKNSDIYIVQSKNIIDLKIFYEIYQKTAKRHNFVPFSLNYLEKEFSSFKKDNQIVIFLGKYKSKIISSAIIVYWQDRGFYHHGASLSEYNKIPVSYLLQWRAIKEAKLRGCKIYNFWGIKEEGLNKKKHPWDGLTLFKRGFGGYKKEYLKTQDLVFSCRYWINYFIEKARKIKRGF